MLYVFLNFILSIFALWVCLFYVNKKTFFTHEKWGIRTEYATSPTYGPLLVYENFRNNYSDRLFNCNNL